MSDSNSTQSSLEQLYTERSQQWSSEVETTAARSRLVSNLRGLAFAVFAFAGLVAIFGSEGEIAGVVSAIGGVAFVILVFWHARVLSAEQEARRWLRVNRDALLRAGERWRELSDDGQDLTPQAHAYADDLDLFGPGSLFQRLCTAHTHFGRTRLADYLQQPASPEEIEQRQTAVRALAAELDLRQRLEAMALGSAEVDEPNPKRKRQPPADPTPLLSWAEGEPELKPKRWVIWASRVLPPITIAGFVGWASFGLPLFAWTAPLILQAVALYATRNETSQVFQAVSSTEGAFVRYGAMLELLESLDTRSQILADLKAALMTADSKPSVAMRQFRSRVGWFDLRHNGLVHPFINWLFLWDIHCVHALETWQQRWGKQVRGWFRALGEAEALSALANLAHDEPEWCFPSVARENVNFVATELAHPLLPRKASVPNSVNLDESGRALLVTGSNMSGKSTWLRSMGVAAVMAQAGAPVCAQQLRMRPLRVHTSIRIADSLQSGVSHFYAEVQKLKDVVDAAGSQSDSSAVLFLLDEILHGTNSRERQIGARWVLAELISRSAIGAVSTHDMGLCQLPEPLMQHVEQVHFRESVQGDRMTFDYKLRPGPVTAGNALRLMRTVGLDVPLE